MLHRVGVLGYIMYPITVRPAEVPGDTMRKADKRIAVLLVIVLFHLMASGLTASGQNQETEGQKERARAALLQKKRGSVRPVTIPITLRLRGESKERRELETTGNLTVR